MKEESYKMKHLRILFLVSILSLTISAVAQSQTAQPTGPATVSAIADSEIRIIENDIVPAAEAMPEDKYNFVPTTGEFKGVRTFAEQVKHVATTNYSFWSSVLGEKPAVDVSNENGPASMKSKAEIVKYLKDSFAVGHRAAKFLTTENMGERVDSGFGKRPRLFLTSFTVAHAFDHYGQMVEYLRLNGIIPPASRPRN
jgi:uncharacterized damage-inducible protein DinB